MAKNMLMRVLRSTCTRLTRIRGPDLDDPVVGSIGLGYQFSDEWATDLFLGTDLGGDTNINTALLNVYRFFGLKKWRPYVSLGIGSFSLDDVTEDPTEEIRGRFWRVHDVIGHDGTQAWLPALL